MNNKLHHIVAWLALIISIIALILGWRAFNRSGQDLGPTSQEEIDDIRKETRRNIANAEARIKLMGLRLKLMADNNYEEAQRGVEETRQQLEESYQDAEGASLQQWREFDADLERLEQFLRNQSADALGVMESLISRLKQEIRRDN